MRLLLFILAIILPKAVLAGAFTSTGNGLFSAGGTWVGGVAPSAAGDTWTIAAGHAVVYDMDNSGGAGWGASVVTGNLVMTNTGSQAFLKMQGHLSGAGNWRIGSSNTPIAYVSTNLPGVVIEFTGAAQCTMAGTNNLGWYGDSSHMATTYLSVAATNGAASITVSNVPPNVTTNDVIWVGNSNTVGQAAAEYYVVGSVSGSTISFLPAPLGTATNHWPGIAFRTATSSARPAGTAVAFLSQSIVVRETTQRTVQTVTASQSNTMTGVLCQNLGNGLARNCSNWTVYSNTVNNCANGGLANYNCANWTAYSNTVNNCSNGGLAYNCSNWTAYSNTVNNCVYGGLAYYNCTNWTVYSNTVNNCSYGGLAYNCANWTVYSNTVTNCSSGGLAYYCSNVIAYSNTLSNTSPLVVTSVDCVLQSNSIGFTTDTHVGVGYGFNIIKFDNTYWLGPWGGVVSTNALGLPLQKHNITTAGTNAFVGAWHPVSIRPGGSRIVNVWAYQTNNVAYYGAVIPVGGNIASPSQLTMIATNAPSGGWTNLVFTITNPDTNAPLNGRVWVATTAKTAPATGYTFIEQSSDAIGKQQ